MFLFGPVSAAVPPNTKIIADGGFRGLEKVAIPYPWGEVKCETDIERRVEKKIA